MAVLVLASLLGACGDTGGAAAPRAVGIDTARSFRAFPLYFAGFRAGGLPLTDAGRGELRNRLPGRQVGFIYGKCTPDPQSDESGCGALLAVVNAPSCFKHPALYRNAGGPYRTVRLRGVPARVFRQGDDGSTRIELYSRITTVVVSADTEALALRVVRRLRGVNTRVSPAAPLPPPRRSDLIGAARCP